MEKHFVVFQMFIKMLMWLTDQLANFFLFFSVIKSLSDW